MLESMRDGKIENALIVASLPEYDELTVEIVLNTHSIAQLQREEGERNMRIEFFESVETTVSMDKFADYLKQAYEELLIRGEGLEPAIELEYQARNAEKRLIPAEGNSKVKIWINQDYLGHLQKGKGDNFELILSTNEEISIYMDEFIELMERAKKKLA